MPIAVTLDLHANIGQAMVDRVDVITTYDTYPHVDAAERAREAVDLLARTIRGEIRPAMALAKPPLMPVPQAIATAEGPFKTSSTAPSPWSAPARRLRSRSPAGSPTPTFPKRASGSWSPPMTI